MPDHLRREAQRQIGERADVQVDHAQLRVAVHVDGESEHAEAGIVDQIFHFDTGALQRAFDGRAGIGLLEIAGNNDRRRAAGGDDLVRQRGEALGTARHQRQTVFVRGEDANHLGANSRRSTGNQRHALNHGNSLASMA